ncbi:histidinol-phosphate aminotransferase [Desulfitispora alkaliphila]|uniref:histidinol-phosphate transaminase n=1 Tax=Desulfitispora alkaliphila TaxID=622674 RepID=UPI003D198546
MLAELIRKTILRIKPYVPGKPIEEVKRELGLNEIIKLASNENPYGASAKAVEAMKQTIEKIHIYPDANGFELKVALGEKYGFDPQCFILGNGSDENIKMIAQAFLNPGEEVVFGAPSFMAYDFAAKVMDAEVKAVPLKENCYDLEGMLQEITDKTKLVFICNPNNPTGTIVKKHQLEQFINQLPEHVIAVIDEAYAQYADDPQFVSGIDYVRQGKQVIVLRTFSKIYGLAGIRVGYGIASPEIIAMIERVREPFNTNLVAQAGAIAALRDAAHLSFCRKENIIQKKVLEDQFKKLGLSWIDTQANFIMLDTGIDATELHQEMLKQGVIIRPGHVFGMPTYIRVTIGTPEENKKFIEALKNSMKILEK